MPANEYYLDEIGLKSVQPGDHIALVCGESWVIVQMLSKEIHENFDQALQDKDPKRIWPLLLAGDMDSQRQELRGKIAEEFPRWDLESPFLIFEEIVARSYLPKKNAEKRTGDEMYSRLVRMID